MEQLKSTNNKKAAFVCPIYNSGCHFESGMNLYKSAIRFGIEEALFFIYSSSDDKNNFEFKCKEVCGYIPNGLVCDVIENHCKCPVTIKKYFGLMNLLSDFEYISTIDDETEFVRKFSPYELMDSIWKSGSNLSANISTGLGRNVLKSCAETIGLANNKLLNKETLGLRFYWWFNEIPVYRGETLPEFFDWMNNNNIVKGINENYYCFDYLVYVIWLITNKGAKLKKYYLFFPDGVIESFVRNSRYKLMTYKKMLSLEKRFHTHWTSRSNNLNDNPDICIRMQIDHQTMDIAEIVGFGKFKALLKKVYYFIC